MVVVLQYIILFDTEEKKGWEVRFPKWWEPVEIGKKIATFRCNSQKKWGNEEGASK